MKIVKEYTILVIIIIIFLIAVILNTQNNKLVLNLTLEEKQYIKNNPVILLGSDPDFAPVEFYEDGEFKGIVPDLVKYINKNTELNIKIIKYNTWDDVIKAIKLKEIDILGAVSKTNSRKFFLDFSINYLSIPNVLVTKKNSQISIESNFSNLNIAVVNSSAKHDLLLENYPKANAIPMKNVQYCLKAVSLGRVDAHLGSLTQMSYYIDKYKFSNLKINMKLDKALRYSYPIHFAVQKDNDILKSIINKILLSMPTKKKIE